jgi:DNA-binding CsgD family transcriptional regulator
MTADQKKTILDQFERGVPLVQISKEVDLPYANVRQFVVHFYGPQYTQHLKHAKKSGVLTPQEEQELRTFWREGATWDELLEMYGISAARLGKIVGREHKPSSPGGKQEKIMQYYAAGMRVEDIARVFEVSVSYVYSLSGKRKILREARPKGRVFTRAERVLVKEMFLQGASINRVAGTLEVDFRRAQGLLEELGLDVTLPPKTRQIRWMRDQGATPQEIAKQLMLKLPVVEEALR